MHTAKALGAPILPGCSEQELPFTDCLVVHGNRCNTKANNNSSSHQVLIGDYF